MASLATVSLQEPIIPLISSFKVDDLALTKIEHRWTEGTTAREGKMCLPMCPDGQNKELLLYVVDQFLDAAEVLIGMDDAFEGRQVVVVRNPGLVVAELEGVVEAPV